MTALNKLIFLIFICYSTLFNAQINLDSLNSVLPTLEGTDKVDLLNKIAWEYKFSDPDRAFELSEESINLSKSIRYVKGEAHAFYQIAAFHYLGGNISTSIENSKKSIALYERLNNSLGVARNWNMIGMDLDRLDNYSEALLYYEKAITTCKLFGYDELMQTVQANVANLSYAKGDYKKAIEDYSILASSWLAKGDTLGYYNTLGNIAKSQEKMGKYTEALKNFFEIETFEKSKNRKHFLANTYNSIGALYLKLGLTEPTLEMFKKAIEIYQELGNHRKLAILNENVGVYYSENEVLEKAEFFYNKALQINDSLKLKNSGRIYNHIASLKIKKNEFDDALTLLNKSLKINLSTGEKNQIGLNYANLGAIYFELEQFQKSEEYYLKALDIWTEIGDVFEEEKASEALAKIYKLTNNKASGFYAAKAQAASDSLFSKQKFIEINKLMVTKLYEENKKSTNKLNQELSVAKEQLTLAENKNKSFFIRYKVPFFSIIALLVLGLIWLFKQQQQTSRLNKTIKNKATEDQEKYETSLESKNKELALLSLETAQQTDFFKKIHDSLQKIIAKNPENLEIKKLEKILNTHSMDKNSWENFTSYFNEVYVGFFDRISKSYPSITNKELQLCALIRLKIPIYEASLILGISPRSIHKSRYRIRKKMGLDSEAKIDDFIGSI